MPCTRRPSKSDSATVFQVYGTELGISTGTQGLSRRDRTIDALLERGAPLASLKGSTSHLSGVDGHYHCPGAGNLDNPLS